MQHGDDAVGASLPAFCCFDVGEDLAVVDAGVQVAHDWGLVRDMMAGEGNRCRVVHLLSYVSLM
jgi:hypothetical protein